LVISPDGSPVAATEQRRRVDDALVKAIARAFRWQELLENGTYATIAEIAKAEKINETYVGRILRLTLLAPDLVEAILNGRQPCEIQLDGLHRSLPVCWQTQHGALGFPERANSQRLLPGTAWSLRGQLRSQGLR
jgi:hypothetical protein